MTNEFGIRTDQAWRTEELTLDRRGLVLGWTDGRKHHVGQLAVDGLNVGPPRLLAIMLQ